MTTTSRRSGGFLLGGLLVALLLAGVLSFWASSDPDGLNKVAADQGFADSETPHPARDSWLAGYAVRGIDNEFVSNAVAGVSGVAITLLVGGALFLTLRRSGAGRTRSAERTEPSGPAVPTGRSEPTGQPDARTE